VLKRGGSFVLLSLVVTAACTFDPKLPSAVITCSEERPECPPGHVCRLSVGRCLAVSVGAEAPRLENVVLDKVLARRGDELVVTFHTTRPLIGRPPVRLVEAGRVVAMEVAGEGSDFTARWSLGPDDVEGSARLETTLVGSDGAEAPDQALGGVMLDFTAPSLVPGSSGLRLVAASQLAQGTTALGRGGRVEVRFALDEPGHAVMTSSPALLSFEERSAVATGFEFGAVAGATGGRVALRALVSDLAGNEATLGFGELEVDLEAPAAPDTLSQTAIVHRRVRWGATGVPAGFTVVGAAGAAPLDSEVVALDPAGLVLGRAQVSSDGHFTLPLVSDGPRLSLVALDAAGNESPRAEVKNVEWVGSTAGRVVGRPSTNPNWLEVAGDFHRSLPVMGEERSVPITTAALPSWQWASATPSNVKAAAVAPDGTIAVWLGLPLTQASRGFGIARRWRGQWRHELDNSLLVDSPVLEFDSAGRLFVFGEDGTPSNLFGIHDGAKWVVPSGARPQPRIGAQLVWDPNRRELLVFGGARNPFQPVLTDDFATWDGTRWALGTTGVEHAWGDCAWDRQRDRLVMVGGVGASADRRETWEWDRTSWVRSTPAVRPPQLGSGALAWDPTRRQVVLFGLEEGNPASLEVWTWNGTGWTRLPSPPNPGLTQVLAGGWNPSENAFWVIGSDTNKDVWLGTWNVGALVQVSKPAEYAAFAYVEDLAGRRLLRVRDDGRVEAGSSGDWHVVHPDGDAGRAVEAVWFDPLRQRLVVAEAARVSEWRDDAGWAVVDAGGFDVRAGVWSSALGRSLAVSSDGGVSSWNGLSWVSFPSRGQPTGCRIGPTTIASDEPNAALVLYGSSADGGSLCTWTLDAGWRSDRAPGRVGSSLARGRDGEVLVLGGTGVAFQGQSDEVWRRTDGGWQNAPPLPFGADESRSVWDSARGELLVFPRNPVNGWALHGLSPFQQPMVAGHFVLNELDSSDELKAVRISVVAGGEGAVGGTFDAGVTLWRADPRNGFLPLAGAPHPLASPAPLSWSSDDAGTLQELFVGAGRELVLGVTPPGPHLDGRPATLRVNDVFVEVRWRRP